MSCGRVLLGLAALLGFALPAAAAPPLSVRDSFRIGSGGSVLCSAETLTVDRALTDMFDRGYAMLCRDAAAPVGRLYVLRERGLDPAARLAAIRNERVTCRPGPDAGRPDAHISLQWTVGFVRRGPGPYHPGARRRR